MYGTIPFICANAVDTASADATAEISVPVAVPVDTEEQAEMRSAYVALLRPELLRLFTRFKAAIALAQSASAGEETAPTGSETTATGSETAATGSETPAADTAVDTDSATTTTSASEDAGTTLCSGELSPQRLV
jgi:hypothetical protein